MENNKLTKILMVIWAVLALASFVSGWFAPLFWGIVNWTFGGLNLMIIGSLLIALVQSRKAYKMQEKQLAEQNQVEE